MNSVPIPRGTRFADYAFYEQTVDLGNGSAITLCRIRNLNDLLDSMTQEEFERRDEIMPYWADLWPGALGLARYTASLDCTGRAVLDLGCGLGLNGIVCARSGGIVTFTDYDIEALRFARHNMALNRCAPYYGFTADWNRWPLTNRFDLVLGADVIYEERNHAPLIAVLKQCLAPGGTALFSDPQRTHHRAFGTACEQSGFTCTTHTVPIDFLNSRQNVVIFRISS